MANATQTGHLYFVGPQPYGIRVLRDDHNGESVLWQCPTCRRFSQAPHTVEAGDEGPTLVPAPNWPAEIVCGHMDCRATWLVWRGVGFPRGPEVAQ